MKYKQFIEDNTLRCEASHRGGGIEIDASELLGEGVRMSAYQNYLGGGLRGSIQIVSNVDIASLSKNKQRIHYELGNNLKHYLYGLTNEADGNDEYTSLDFLKQQSMPVSGY